MAQKPIDDLLTMIPQSVGGLAAGVVQEVAMRSLDAPATKSYAPQDVLAQIPPGVGGQAQEMQPAPMAEEEETDDPGFWAKMADIFTGASREIPEIKGLPEFISSEAGALPGGAMSKIKTLTGLLIAAGDEGKKQIIEENIPGVKFTELPGGLTTIELPDGTKSILNKPGFSLQDGAELAADMVAFLPAAKVARLGKGLFSRVAIGTTASAATEAGLQKGERTLGSKRGMNVVDVVVSGLLGGLGEAGAVGIEALRKRGAIRTLGADISPQVGGGGALPPGTPPTMPSAAAQPPEGSFVREILEDVKRGEKVVEKTGIPLFRAQKTMDPTDIDRQSYVSLLSGSSRVAARALKNQNKKSYDAVVDFLATVAPEQQVGGAAVRARSAAEMVIDAQKGLRKEAASPFYKEAFRNRTRYQPQTTRDLIIEKADRAASGSSLDSALKKITRFLKPKGTEAEITAGLRIDQLHESKRAIDGMIGAAVRKADNPLAKDLIDVKKSLITEMKTFSPNYDAARRKFAAQSPAVEALENSLIGRVAGLKDTQLKFVTSTIFDPADIGTSIPNVKMAKKAIQDVDPGAWRDITRLELEKRMGGARDSLEKVGETTANIPGIIQRALFKPKKKRDLLYAALDTEQRKNLRYLEEALSRASKGRPGGSPTATRLRFEKEITGVGAKIITLFTRPLKTTSTGAQEFNFNKNAFALGKIMFDPNWKPDMRKLRKFKPDSPESAAMFSDMMTRATKDFRSPAAQATRRQAMESEGRPNPAYPYIEPGDRIVRNGVK